MKKSIKSLVWVALFLLSSTRLFAWNYTNQELGFSATLPDGFSDISHQTKVKCLVAQGKFDSSKNGHFEVIVIQDLGAALGREDLSKRTDIPAKASLEKTAWKGFSDNAYRVTEDSESGSVITLNVQIPLKPHAIELTVSGPERDEGKLRTDMLAIVATIDGPTNWLTDEQDRRFRTNWIAVFAGIACHDYGQTSGLYPGDYGVIGTGGPHRRILYPRSGDWSDLSRHYDIC